MGKKVQRKKWVLKMRQKMLQESHVERTELLNHLQKSFVNLANFHRLQLERGLFILAFFELLQILIIVFSVMRLKELDYWIMNFGPQKLKVLDGDKVHIFSCLGAVEVSVKISKNP